MDRRCLNEKTHQRSLKSNINNFTRINTLHKGVFEKISSDTVKYDV